MGSIPIISTSRQCRLPKLGELRKKLGVRHTMERERKAKENEQGEKVIRISALEYNGL